MNIFHKSEILFEKAQSLFPGGVNSPVRAFKSVGCNPIFLKSAQGAYLKDVDENEYIDYINSWGPTICGHAHPLVIEAVQKAAERGLTFGASTEYEIELAELVKSLMPNLEILRFVTSGTEACMSAIRLARAYTNRPKIVKFAGCYHGHYDSFLVQAGSGVATLGLPDSPGVLVNIASQTITVEYNDLIALRNVFEENLNEIACVIVEPVVGNAGCILPKEGYLQGLRSLCDEFGALLVFDEVMTGFRLAPGGAQEKFNIKPDLVTLGKILGGGLPVGAYGGKAEIMKMVAPSGPMYQAGTLSGNPLGMAAGKATLEIIREPDFHKQLEETGQKLEDGMKIIAKNKNIPIVLNRCGSMLSVFFTEAEAVTDYKTAKSANTEKFGSFFRNMLKNGIYLPPSQFEAWFFSSAITQSEIDKTLIAFEKSI